MHEPLCQQLLDQILRIIEQARPLVEVVARRDRDLGSQIRRALSSIALNTSEAFGCTAGNARLRFETARGSLYETRTGLRVAIAWGYLSPAQCTPTLEALDHLGARLHGLTRR